MDRRVSYVELFYDLVFVAVIARASAARVDAPEIAVADGRVHVGPGAAAAPAAVWVAYFRRTIANDVPRGENAKRFA